MGVVVQFPRVPKSRPDSTTTWKERMRQMREKQWRQIEDEYWTGEDFEEGRCSFKDIGEFRPR
jgi:hypothetical protein